MKPCSNLTEDYLKWPKRYMKIAVDVSQWSTCLSRKVGCVITKNNRIVATGYNGAPANVKSCKELGRCIRETSESGTNLDMCMATHAEQNAITQAARLGISIEGGDAYITTKPCTTCIKLLINSGINRVFYSEEYNNPLTDSIAKEAGVLLVKLESF